MVNAKKTRFDAAAARALLKQVDIVYAAKGQKVVRLDLKKDKPSDAEIDAAIIGPSGALRAPAIRKGRVLFVGFHEAEFSDLIAG